MCAEILEAGQACLVPLGALAPLSSGMLVYPEGSRAALLDSSAELGCPLDSGQPGDAR